MPAGDLAAACDENAKAVRARFSPLARELNVNIVAGSVSNLPRRAQSSTPPASSTARARASPNTTRPTPSRRWASTRSTPPATTSSPSRWTACAAAFSSATRCAFPSCGARWRCAERRSCSCPPSGRRRANTTGRRSPPPARSKTSSLSSRATPAASATARCTAAFRASSTRWARS